jgi:MFS transporter, UMF1 family
VNRDGSHGAGTPIDRALPITSWALYDFANTIFYAVVVTRYLPLQILEETGRHTSIYWGLFPAMLSAAFLAPWLGGYVERRGMSRRSVLVLTFCCVVCTALLSAAGSVVFLLALFALAQIFYQLALVPYNNLLPAVASPRLMGRVSGLGVGLGYAGVILSLWVVDALLVRYPGYGTAYKAAALLFFLFTIPFFLFVPEKKAQGRGLPLPRLFEFVALLKDPDRRRFIIGNFLCADALNAILIFISVYLKKGLGFEDASILDLLILLNVAALAGGLLCGYLTDRFSPRWTMVLAALLLGAAVGVAEFATLRSVAFWSIAVLGGPGVAGLWVAGRKWVVELSPGGKTGSLFGLYGLTNKLSLLNVILFAALADWTGSYSLSVLVLILSLLGGIFFLLRTGRPAETGRRAETGRPAETGRRAET